MKFYASQTNV